MTRVYIALGSNLANPLHQVQSALNALAELPQTTLIATSSLYRTPPLGPQDQPDYLNAVVALDTDLSAENLLDHTQKSSWSTVACVKMNAGAHARWISIFCCSAMK